MKLFDFFRHFFKNEKNEPQAGYNMKTNLIADLPQSTNFQPLDFSVLDNADELLSNAIDVLFDTNQASVSILQRRLRIGYSRASRIIDQMEQLGIVSPFNGSTPRKILISREEWEESQRLDHDSYMSPEKYREMEEAWLEQHYDLNTAEGILAIPEIANPPKWPGCEAGDITGDIDYYLRFKSAAHEKNGRFDLAILCLQKSNAIRMIKRAGYRKSDYYRLVRILAQNGYIMEAYKEKDKIDALFGPYHLDSIENTLIALNNLKKYADAEDLRRNSIEEAEKNREYLENIIPFEIRRGQDMRDYAWLQSNLPGICPKSLTGYRRMKNQNTNNYQKLIVEAKGLGYIIK